MTASQGPPSDEPLEETLPAKPDIEDMPPEEGVEPPTDKEEANTEEDEEVLSPREAEKSDTIDNAEEETYPD